MLYETAADWRDAASRSVALIGMSGVGKTRIASMLREQSDWFHYSVDYRIGTRHLGERIADDFKREAMKSPMLRELLRSDSIKIRSNLSFHNLTPLSMWLGKPGDPDKGGIPFEEYVERQRLHRAAETAALIDSREFIERAARVYGYPHFVCDTSGSIVEVVDPEDRLDRTLASLSRAMLIVYIRGSEAHVDALKARFDRSPKPMYYQEAFLREAWERYLSERGIAADKADPDDFIRWGFAELIEHRRPRYQAVADRWGVTVEADEIAAVETAADFDDLIAEAIARTPA